MPSSRNPNPEAPHLVAKIGGSLWASPTLKAWLAALKLFPHRLTIVPGGGPFADAVRRAQHTIGFSDRAAHRMALLAMEQYAIALADLHPEFAAVATPQEGFAAHRRGAAVALWRPVAMASAAPHIPESWDITSDSLAAWYASEAGASALLLVKSVDIASRVTDGNPRSRAEEAPEEPSRSTRASSRGRRMKVSSSFETRPPVAPQDEETFTPSSDGASGDDLVGAGVVDPMFPHYARGLRVFIAGPSDLRDAGERSSRGTVPGVELHVLNSREQKIAS
ncbi:MAG: aspartate kinase [Methylocystaceae bacterium]|nr:MAG: aspartate kinase [Methylocystaceae bacterium]